MNIAIGVIINVQGIKTTRPLIPDNPVLQLQKIFSSNNGSQAGNYFSVSRDSGWHTPTFPLIVARFPITKHVFGAETNEQKLFLFQLTFEKVLQL